MGETEAKVGRRIGSDLRHDNHTVSLLTDHLVFSPKVQREGVARRGGGAAEENIDEEKEKALKTGYITLYTKFFRGKESRHQK